MANSAEISSARQDRRKASTDRHLLRLTGTLVNLECSPGGPLAAAMIRNISPTGVLLETELPAAMGQLVQIDLGSAGRQEARIRWVDGRLLGCQFSEPLTKSRMSAALLQGETVLPERSGDISGTSQRQTQATQRDFGLAIAWARKVKGINQAELAKAIGVSTTTICKWERGHATPRAGALVRLQDFVQDAETSAARPERSRPKESNLASQDLPAIISQCRASLADHLGLDHDAIEVQIVINGSVRPKADRVRR